MTAIFKREFLSYFRSPVGYVAIALFSFLSGFVFYSQFATGAVDIASEVISLRSFFFVIVPIITMGLLSEDKKRGTDVLYYTTPINLFNVVTGNCGGVFSVGAVGTIIVFFFMAFMFISIGLFASAITDNQIISAIVAFIIILVTQLLGTIGDYLGSSFTSMFSGINTSFANNVGNAISSAINWLDPFLKTQDFRLGIFSVSSLVFLVSVGILFLYLTFRVLDKKRWSQA